MTIIAIGYTQIPFNIYLVKEIARYIGRTQTTEKYYHKTCAKILAFLRVYRYESQRKVEMVLMIKRTGSNSLCPPHSSIAPYTFVSSKTD